ncbi:MAG: phosphotransferase [Proteobacteria bacterium]|nr:phosphotransferase [Pseudomonadota bacterium]
MDRHKALLAWTQEVLNDPDCYIKSASSDASFRSYWRVFSQDRTFIIMDAPVEHENCQPFIDISARLVEAGVNVVKVIAQNLTQGFLLLTDLGTVQYLEVLNNATCLSLYTDALNSLHTMQQQTAIDGLPQYDSILLKSELDLFAQWFVNVHLDTTLTTKQKTILSSCNELLIKNALSQPQVFVHRDYHSRNLMRTKDNNPGILDFQDAVIGAVTYDLVSLLKDCYIRWDDEIIWQLSDGFRQKYNSLNHTNINSKQWQRWFDLMGLQRHLKVVGIFCRLNYRDNKANYLKDLNLTLCYIKGVCIKYDEFHALLELINAISPSMESLCRS